MKLSMIYACDLTGAIGFQGSLPWGYIQRDMEWFRACTAGKVILMGRNTWDSIGVKLPGRINVVISNRAVKGADLVLSGKVSDVIMALGKKYPGQEVVVMGGAEIYRAFMPLCEKFYTTLVQDSYKADTYYDCRIQLAEAYKLKDTIEILETERSPGLLLQIWEQPLH